MDNDMYVPATIVKIISRETKRGYRRNFRKEDRIYNDLYIESKNLSSFSYGDVSERDYEDELLFQADFTEIVEKDCMGNPVLKSYQRWEEYTLLIEYTYENKTYFERVVVDSDSDEYEVGQNVFVLLNIENPKQVYGIFDRDLNEGLSIYYIIWMCGLFFLFVIVFLAYLSIR